jgi:hypothetical protein
MVPLFLGHREAVGRLLPPPASLVEGPSQITAAAGRGGGGGVWGSDINLRVPYPQAPMWEFHSYQFHMWESHSTTNGSQYHHKVILESRIHARGPILWAPGGSLPSKDQSL